MAAVVTERWSGRVKSRGDYDKDKSVRIFDVTGVTTNDEAMDAVANMTTLWPAYVGKVIDNTGNAYLSCSNIDSRPQTNSLAQTIPGFFEVTATYGVGNFVPPEKPVNLPWKYLWKNVTIEVPFDRDINGHPIVNSARCPFSSQATKRVSYKSLQITRFEPFYNYALYKTYENTVNSDTIQFLQPNGDYTTFGPGTVFCVSIQPAGAYTQLDNYLGMVLDFELWDLSTLPSGISDPFQFQVLDQGSMGYSAGPTKGNLWTSQGSQVSTDQQLNGYGLPVDTTLTVEGATPVAFSTSLPPGATLLQPTTNAFFLKYLRYQSQAMLPLINEPVQPRPIIYTGT